MTGRATSDGAVERWAVELTNVAIAAQEGVTAAVVANALCRARQAGADVGMSPHYVAGRSPA